MAPSRKVPWRIHDPSHVMLRRGLRVAVLVPAIYFAFLVVFQQKDAALPAAFATFSILAFADFGGPPWDRLRANVSLGLTGTLLYAVGLLVGENSAAAVASTFVVGGLVAFAGVLRGYFSAATTAVLVPWVLAVTAHTPMAIIPGKIAGWAIGAAVAVVGAAVLWPGHGRSTLRIAMAECVEAAAELVEALGVSGEGDLAQLRRQRLDECFDELHKAYDGRMVRPGVGTSRDRSLVLAFDQLHRLRAELHDWHVNIHEVRRQDDRALAEATSSALADCATALRRGFGVSAAPVLALAREEHVKRLVDWAATQNAGAHPGRFRADVEAGFSVRSSSLVVQQLATYVQGALDSRDRVIGRRALDRPVPVEFAGETLLDPQQATPVRTLLAAQLAPGSPWLRTGLRTGLALGLTVLVSELTGGHYGFWISLGALVALKVDAAGTRKTAATVLIGTLVGFALATAMILTIGDHVAVYWWLLPALTFLAAYTPGAVSVAVGQGAFTVFILSLFGILYPSRLSTGVFRVVDVLLGLSVSLVVSALLWPSGLAPMVRKALHRGAIAAGTYFVAAYARLVEGPILAHTVARTRNSADHALVVASETFDLALGQGDAAAQEQVPLWARRFNCVSQLAFDARVVSVLERISPLPRESNATDAMLALAHHVEAQFALSTSPDVDIGTVHVPIPDNRRALARLRRLVDHDIAAIWAMPELPDSQDVDQDGHPAQADVDDDLVRRKSLMALTLIFAEAWLAQALWLSDRVTKLAMGQPDDEVGPFASRPGVGSQAVHVDETGA